MPYITIRWKFIITVAVSTLWMLLSIWLSAPWYDQLSEHTTPFIAAFLIGFIAIIPGFMNAFIMMALALDRRPRVPLFNNYPDVTVLVAAYNEAESIEDTVRSLMHQTYPGKLHVTVINDGSADTTANIVRNLFPEYPNLNLVDLQKNGGKANALNQGLAQCNSPYVITVDADCWIWKDGIQNLVGRRLADPANTRAVAGAILIRNSRQNWLTKAQEWDYFLGIAAIKRIQSLFQGTLVAQGAFSLYDRETLVKVGKTGSPKPKSGTISWVSRQSNVFSLCFKEPWLRKALFRFTTVKPWLKWAAGHTQWAKTLCSRGKFCMLATAWAMLKMPLRLHVALTT